MGKSLKFIVHSALLAAVSLSISCSSNTKMEENVLARIQDLEVTKAHFESAFKQYYYQSGQALQPDFSTKSAILDNEFNVYVLATYARQLGFDEMEESRKMEGMIKRRVLNEEYINRKVLSEISISENDIRNMYVKFNTQLRASHLYAANKQEADSLYNLVKDGRAFEELAADVFQNKRLAESGGDLGVFSVDEMDVAFEKKAYELKVGEISEPVKTAQGYSIIKLTEKISKPILTEYEYLVQKNQLAYFVEKQAMEMVKREHMYQFLENLDINENLVSELWSLVNANFSAFQSSDPEFLTSKHFSDEVLTRYSNRTLSVAEFLEETKFTPTANLNNVQDFDSFSHFVKGIAYRKYLMDEALNNGLDAIDDVQGSIDQSYLVHLAQRAEEQIHSSVKVGDDEIRNAYYTNPGKYEKPLEIDLSRIVVTSEDEAKDILHSLKEGASFTEMVQKHTIRNEERLTDGRLGYEYVQKYGFLSTTLAQLQPGEISGVLFFQTGEYHIYECLGRKETEQFSFKEARELVKEELRKKKFKELRSEIIEQVKREYKAVVDKEKLKELTIQI